VPIPKGTILFVKGFPGDFGLCDKFVFVLGHTSPSSILVFTISSQPRYELQPQYKREMVKIPKGTFSFLPVDSWIQCFHHTHELQIGSYSMTVKGSAYDLYFEDVKRVVRDSDLLNAFQITDCIDVMDNDKSTIL
jgi:hypothetical protein